ncbi:MAG TPA: metallophosphoesterase, partial [Armatimonadota bacterium]|nr:metallophosphoesterase [Armatimonadota bacterium]
MPTSKLTRRTFLRQSALGAAAMTAGVAAADTSDFSFLVINDTHWLDENCSDYLTGAFSYLRAAHDYRFVLVVGDLATGGAVKELRGMADALVQLGAPAYPVMGNHDYAAEKATWVEVFGPRRLNYRFDYHGWTFLGLDSTEEAKYQEMSVQPETIDWLRTALTRI